MLSLSHDRLQNARWLRIQRRSGTQVSLCKAFLNRKKYQDKRIVLEDTCRIPKGAPAKNNYQVVRFFRLPRSLRHREEDGEMIGLVHDRRSAPSAHAPPNQTLNLAVGL